MMNPKRHKNTTLIIAGHGSSKNPNQARPARLHGDYIRSLDLFGDVKTAFWKEETFLKDVLKDVRTEEVVIVPNLACSGHINHVVIPKEMGLNGEVTVQDNRLIHLCRPLGEHPGIAKLIAHRLIEIMRDFELPPYETTVFLAGHGNPNPDRPASHDSTVMMATKIYQHAPMEAILPAFIEEKPFLHGWRNRTQSKNILVLPFMIAAGVHGARDIPKFMGVSPTEEQSEKLREDGSPAGPFYVDGRRIWLLRAMGSHPKMADFIVDIALDKLSRTKVVPAG